MVFIKTIVEGKIIVKALIDTTSKSNTISKRLYNKLEENYGLKGRDWLWIREAKISFGFSLENCKCYAKIEIDDMSIPLIKEDSRPTGDSSSHKASSTKNNLSIAKQAILRFSKSWDFVPKSTEYKSGLAQEEVINIINKILSNTKDRLEGSLFCNNKQRKKHHGIFHNKSETETDSSSSDSESTDSDLYNLNPIKPRKKRQSLEYLIHHVYVKKKKVVSPIRKHHKNKHTNCVRIPDYIHDEVKIDTHSLQYQSSPPVLLLIPEKAVYLYL
ncbi:13980_t:CDS:2 [Racocetra persica]|uniref:13980_t:CDS:1 n=1 Tax=Racocetra persica TaxID=160502 RepID=A0ACA9KR49_9GLOM|nr:13980_t:CDS:2 [Racocetra persica]